MKRLAASLAIAGRESGLGAKDRAAAVRAVLTVLRDRETQRGFAALGNLDVRYARLDVAGILQRWRHEATGKTLRTFERSDPPLIVPIEELAAAVNAGSVAAEQGV